MEEPNKYYRPVHRPHKKISFPGMGKSDDSGDSSVPRRRPVREESDASPWAWAEDLIPKVVPLVVVGFMAFALYDAFRGGNKYDDIVRNPEEIQAATWQNAKVKKKYADVTAKRTRLYLELEDAAGKRVTYDFEKEKGEFWDQVDARNRLTKAAGSNEVSVDTYQRDTTLVMRFR
jgi:hypothetical protein